MMSQDPSAPITQLRDRIRAAWMGKAIGGTLGMPFEGQDGPHDVQFYTPVPTAIVPNDDLDLQVLWACRLAEMDRPRVDRHVLAEAWREHVGFPWCEYGVAIRNLADGLKPPLTGSYDNWYVHGMGAAIRSEIWAALAPGNPRLAGDYAYEDACVDHDGEGIWAEVFLSALQSAAFTESDSCRLLDTALMRLPMTSLIRRAVNETRLWWKQHRDWRAVRESILNRYGHEDFTNATMNVAFIVLAWLAGQHDFGKAICIATNCGKDTDSTTATVGALMGILQPDGIPPQWVEPVGCDLVLSQQITGIKPPNTIDEFTDLVLDLRGRLDEKPPKPRRVIQTTEHLRINVPAAFVNWTVVSRTDSSAPRLPEKSIQMAFDGTVGRLDRESFRDEALLLFYRIRMPQTRSVRIMFNTHEACRVWVDGQYQFGWEGGRMAPSFHMVPSNQFVDMRLAEGWHNLVAAIRRPPCDRTAEWVVGLGDSETMQWIPGVFARD